ncbi:uncharacterized protein LOC126705382 isoform X2 [Quercus robur]|uniref:uncharacterized protein LOC126705382 isoform X2 n=1 Tax=Quercus robur TaxID=38942 RepID=UPI0021634E7C|nr:uncharacterized protein LOC126705382 isoform X2 [Quercus robur]
MFCSGKNKLNGHAFNIALRTCHITKLASSYVVTNTVMKKMTWLAMSGVDVKHHSYNEKVNFSYSEAGENKQALVKLVTCERCADKLHYKRQKEKEQSEKREREENKRKRNRSRSIDETVNDCEGRKERRKGLNIPLVILHFLHDETFLCLYSVHICIYDFILRVKIF